MSTNGEIMSPNNSNSNSQTSMLAFLHRTRRFKLKPLDHISHFTKENHTHKKTCIDPLKNPPQVAKQPRGKMTPQKRHMLLHLRANKKKSDQIQRDSKLASIMRHMAARRIQRFARIRLERRKQKREEYVRARDRRLISADRMPFLHLHRGAVNKRRARRATSARARRSLLQVDKTGDTRDINSVLPTQKPRNNMDSISVMHTTRRTRKKKGVSRFVDRKKKRSTSSTEAAAKITRFLKRCVWSAPDKRNSALNTKRSSSQRNAAVTHRNRMRSVSASLQESTEYLPSRRGTSTNRTAGTPRARRSRCRDVPARRTKRQRQHAQQHAAATVIARTWRGMRDRIRYRQQLQKARAASLALFGRRHRAATLIASTWRGMRERRKFLHRLQKTRAAALVLARHWRGFQCRRSYAYYIKRTRKALVTITRWWREVRARRACAQKRQERQLMLEKAATEISRHWRGWRAWSHVSTIRRIRQQHAAVTTIARHWRGMAGRCRYRWRRHVQTRLREDCASKLIQVVYKLWRLRNRRSQHTRHTSKLKKISNKAKTKTKTKFVSSRRGRGNVKSAGRRKNIGNGGGARSRRSRGGNAGAKKASDNRLNNGNGRNSGNRARSSGGGDSNSKSSSAVEQSARGREHPYWNSRRMDWSSQGSELTRNTASKTRPASATHADGMVFSDFRPHLRRQSSRGGMYTIRTLSTRQSASKSNDDEYECFASFDDF